MSSSSDWIGAVARVGLGWVGLGWVGWGEVGRVQGRGWVGWSARVKLRLFLAKPECGSDGRVTADTSTAAKRLT
ncbi:hypothetical protein Pcinc_034961 [Petrolisthes cinctipes]|uniref:Uncharacterized protein n=1 Tax=Petrolisthes cinctipes TaxID=88211 RepID=A0AAE1BXH2_PETCI|nr:hypothetical protein Pcinc_034961 [Petrolisthes cinctipes]